MAGVVTLFEDGFVEGVVGAGSADAEFFTDFDNGVFDFCVGEIGEFSREAEVQFGHGLGSRRAGFEGACIHFEVVGLFLAGDFEAGDFEEFGAVFWGEHVVGAFPLGAVGVPFGGLGQDAGSAIKRFNGEMKGMRYLFHRNLVWNAVKIDVISNSLPGQSCSPGKINL